MGSNIVDKTKCGECSKCGECCTAFIPFTEKELKTIKKYVKEHKIKLRNRILPDGFDGGCAFLDLETRECMIYEVRPFVCRDFLCSHKDWRKRRDDYAKRAKYNSIYANPLTVATFDDLIFDDLNLLVNYIVDCSKDEDGKVDQKNFIKYCKAFGRNDVLEHCEMLLDDGSKVKGTDL